MTKSIDKFMACLTTGGFLTMVELLIGRVDYSLIFLFIVMIADLISGLMAAIKHKELNSTICMNGLFRKLMILLYVIIAYHMDVLFKVEYIRTFVCWMYATSEILSIFENGLRLEVNIPEPIKNALELFNNKKGDNENENK